MHGILHLVLFVAGFVFGAAVFKWAAIGKAIGTLRIDNSDSEGPYLFLELKHDIPYGQKHVLLTVKEENYISRD